MNLWIVRILWTICHDYGMPLPISRSEKEMGASSGDLMNPKLGSGQAQLRSRPRCPANPLGGVLSQIWHRCGSVQDFLVLTSVEDRCKPKIRLEHIRVSVKGRYEKTLPHT